MDRILKVGWECEKCTLVNDPRLSACELCGAACSGAPRSRVQWAASAADAEPTPDPQEAAAAPLPPAQIKVGHASHDLRDLAGSGWRRVYIGRNSDLQHLGPGGEHLGNPAVMIDQNDPDARYDACTMCDDDNDDDGYCGGDGNLVAWPSASDPVWRA